MKKNLLILLISQLFIFNSFSQKNVYYLNEKMNVGCNGVNPMTDFTKKFTISFNGEDALLSYGSVNCKQDRDCSNFGRVNSTTPGILYMNDDLNIGFISENNEKIIVIRKEDKTFKIIGVAHIDKSSAESVSISSEMVKYQNELNDFNGLLKKLKQSQGMRKLNAIAAADSASTFLDGQEILKDSRGMSGIYYSTFPIKLTFDLSNSSIPTPYAKKFLVNFDETQPNPVLSINSQYAFETTDRTKFVKRATFWLDGYWRNVLQKTSVFASSEADNVDNHKYEYYTHSKTTDLQGNSMLGEDFLTTFDGMIYEAEPGILFILGGAMDTESFKKDLNHAKKFGVIVILYKSEKASAVAKYTNEVAWDKIKELTDKINTAGNATTATLPVQTFEDSKISAETLEFAKAEAAKLHPKEQVQYTYIAGNDWNIVRDKNSGAIVKRTLRIIVVVKIGNQCAFENASITQNYDGSNYGRSIWGGSGAPVYFDCKNINLYK